MGMDMFFNGGGASLPEIPEVTPMPSQNEKEAESLAVRDEERRRLRARKSLSNTILTSPLGTGGGGMGILGRNQ